METGIHIGNKDMHESAKDTADAINSIFKAAHENSIDQDTIRAGLDAFSHVAEVKNVTISNCSVVSNPNPVVPEANGPAPTTAATPPTEDEDDDQE